MGLEPTKDNPPKTVVEVLEPVPGGWDERIIVITNRDEGIAEVTCADGRRVLVWVTG